MAPTGQIDRLAPPGAGRASIAARLPAAAQVQLDSSIRLSRAVSVSDKQIGPFRRQRLEFVKRYGGPYFGKGYNVAEPFNIIFSIVSTLVPALMFEPRMTITTRHPELDEFANLLRLRCDHTLEEIEFDDVVRDVVLDSLFGAAVTKTGLAPSGMELHDAQGNFMADPGKPFVDRVDMDDYVVDMTARHRNEVAWEGNRFYVPFELAMDGGLFDRARLELLRSNMQTSHRQDQVRDLTKSAAKSVYDEGYYDRICLMDVWLPAENMVVTMSGDPEENVGYLAEVEWDGPESGPYDMWSFSRVPSNILPLPLICVLFDMAQMINRMARKMIRRGEAVKDVGVFNKGEEKDAEAVRVASDGDMVGVIDPTQFTTLKFGGDFKEGFDIVAWLQSYLNRIGGNLDLVGGLQAQAGTLGQDQMNLANARVRIEDWQRQVRRSADKVMEKIAWYEWTNDTLFEKKELYVPFQDSRLGAYIAEWGNEREGDFLDYMFKVDPYQKREGSPEEQYARIRQWIMDIVLPMTQSAGVQGKVLDVAKLVEITGRHLGIEEASQIWKDVPEPVEVQAPARSSQTGTLRNPGQQSRGRPAPMGQIEPSASGKESQNAG